MDVLAERGHKLFVRSTIEPTRSFASPFSGVPFACLLWDHDGQSSAETRSSVTKLLLEAGCRYAVCGGQDCEAWHDTFDDVWLDSGPEGLQRAGVEGDLVTTWHEEERPEEVAYFFVRLVQGVDFDFTRYLVLHVGSGSMKLHVDRWVKKFALSQRAAKRSSRCPR